MYKKPMIATAKPIIVLIVWLCVLAIVLQPVPVSLAQSPDTTAGTAENGVVNTAAHQLFLPLVASSATNTEAGETLLLEATEPTPTADAEHDHGHIHDDSNAHGDYALVERARQRNEPPFVAPATAAVSGPLNVVGRWDPPVTWPFVFASAANLPDGRIVAWGGENPTFFSNAGNTLTAVWDPATGQFLSTDYQAHSMFCAIPTMLEDGRVFVNGGNGTRERTSIFDFRTNGWSRIQDMHAGRWYPGSVALPNGNVFTMLGEPGGPYPELWTPTGGWSLLTGANLNASILSNTSSESNWLPYLYLAPNGAIFHAGPTPQMNWLTASGNGSITNAGLTNTWYPKYSSAVMYDEGKILVAGGAVDGSDPEAPGANQALVLDLTGATPTKTVIAPMAYARKYNNAVMLPTGEALVVGGNTSGLAFSDVGSILTPEIWNPDTQTWRAVADMTVPRNYHSVALLLPDGRVWSGGGGLCACAGDHPDHQIYWPPYLFNADGNLATRPVITTAPNTITYGDAFTVQTSTGITHFSLIKLSGVTHSLNSDLRYLKVPFTTLAANQYQLTVASNPNVLTPGYWMLFAVDAQGAPSVAKVLQVTSTAVEPPPPGTARYVKVEALASVNSDPTAAVAELHVLNGNGAPINRTGWVISADSQETQGGNNAVGNITDSNPATYWRTQWQGATPPYPHALVVDLGSNYVVGGIRYLPRQDAAEGRIADYNIYLSTDGINWGTAVVQGAFPNTAAEQTVLFGLRIDPIISPPQPINTAINYTAVATNGVNPRYKWLFGDGTPETAYASAATIAHSFTQPGLYTVKATVTDDSGAERSTTFTQAIHLPATPNRPSVSMNLVYETRASANNRLWVVNQDNNTVSVFDTVTHAKVTEITVGSKPRSLAVAPDGRVWVTNKGASTISLIDPTTLTVVQTIPLAYGSQPFGIAFAPTGGVGYVALEGAGKLLRFDAATATQTGSVDVGLHVRHLSINSDGSKIYLARFITPRVPGEETATPQMANGRGEIVVVNADLSINQTIGLRYSDKPDTEAQGRGLPNYLGPLVISPDGVNGWTPSKQDNIQRGLLRDGNTLTFQHTVRAISSRVILTTNTEDYAARIDHDNAGVASTALFDKAGNYLFVALETSREIAVVDSYDKSERFRIAVGRAPQGLALSPDGLRLYVNNFMDRSVTVLDLSQLINEGKNVVTTIATYNAVATEQLAANVLTGKQLFYDAKDPRLALDSYLSCATCHNDGGQDGRVWDLTGFGEGLRNTTNLNGRAGMDQGPLHWSNNFNEVQDFEGQIRALAGGTGLMSDTQFNTGTRNQPLGDPKAGVSADLDALAAYIAALNTFAASPHRNADGTLTAAGQAGKTIFQTQNCAQCHTGVAFTDSSANVPHNIGTIKPSSGNRLGAPLTAIDTPTLRDTWATAPYLHDGSAATLADAVQAHSGVALAENDLTSLVTYLTQIDSAEVSAPAPAATACAPTLNKIACENTNPGNPASEWDISGAGDPSIQGFATDSSVNLGETVRFKINTNATAYQLDIYRLGYYGGMGARKIATVLPSATLPQTQPACLPDAATGLIDCGNWAESASWTVPLTATSGIYVAKAIRADSSGASHIVFIVRDDNSNSELLFQTSDTTWQAYNGYGGNSLYGGAPAGRAYKVSYNRPYITREQWPQVWVFNAEYPMVRWLEANGYDVSYTTGVDSARRGAELLEHKLFLSVGHDEYWSANQRANVEAARAAGVNLAFFSGNEVFWKTRWEDSIDGSNSAYRTLVSYKETHAGAKIDPLPNVWTGTWRDPRFSPPADGGKPENSLTGTIFKVNKSDNSTVALTVPAADGKLRLWRNTTVATLAPGAVATLADGTLGYEWDEDADNGFRPAGLFRLSTTTVNNVQILADYGSSYVPGTATHHLTLYRHSSGALVFGAGTIQWPWGLDGNHDRGGSIPDVRMQQATVNLFADMDAQPQTLQPGLVAATKSTDTTAPSSTITAPASGASVIQSRPVIISGTATDTGGRVGGIEVSVDGGVTWRRAEGRETWSFHWTPQTLGAVTMMSRAVDDSGNLETPIGIPVTVESFICPCTIWDNSTTPAIASASDSDAVELGVKFRADVDGYITGIRFYKGANNTGVHVGNLWSHSGQLLASATFVNETATGWQQVAFNPPVAITANTTYVASYHAPVGGYAVNVGYFTTSVDYAPLHALGNGVDGNNGLFRYGASGFPTSSYNASNYWVDVIFNTTVTLDTTPPTVTMTAPANGAVVAGTTTVSANANDNVGVAGVQFRLNGVNLGSEDTAAPYSIAWNTVTTSNGNYQLTAVARDAAGNLTVSTPLAVTIDNPVDTTPPAVVAVSPPNGATNVAVDATLVITFSEAMSAATISGTTIELRDSANNAVAATVSYNVATQAATLAPTSSLINSARYTATVKGGSSDPRVKDVAGNALAANDTWSFTVAGGPGANCPCTIWPATTVPALPSANDPGPIEVGVKFRSDVTGYISGIRFYKGASNTGAHRGNLWSSSGQLLASAIFINETATGWQQVNFASPVAINANTTYIASYHTTSGFYSVNSGYFAASGVDNPPLHALANGVDGGNAVYRYGASGFPTNSFNGANYWVDLVFTTNAGPDTTPPTVVTVAPVAGATDATVDTNVTATFSEALDPTAISGATFELRNAAGVLVAATVSYDTATQSAILTPTNPLVSGAAYTVTLQGGGSDPRVKDVAGNALAADYVWSFTVAGGPLFTCPCTIWPATTVPAVPWANDPDPIEVGVKFRSDVTGYISGIRFYKGVNNTGTHIGNLWSSSGTLLATATFVDETATGWQQVNFASPVAINANTTYIASYHTTSGFYSVNSGYFVGNGVDNPPLRALANGVDGGNAVYRYGASGFPTNSFNGANYWVDLVFELTGTPDTTPPTVALTTPANGAVVAGTVAVSADASDNVGVAGVQFLLNGANLGAEDTNAPYTSAWETTVNANGSYTLTAVARDIAGNTTTAAVRSVTVNNVVDTTPPTVTGVNPNGGATGVVITTTVVMSFSEAMNAATINGTTVALRDAANALVAATVSYNGATRVATLTPTNPLTYAVRYTATVQGGSVDPRVKDLAGNALAADDVWSFTTVAPSATCPCTIWPETATPAIDSANDPSAIEVGVKFQSDMAGYVTGVRFYKGASNTGTHIGNLWSSSGNLLATATFVDETTAGWQQVLFSTPVAINANTTYVASYHTDAGFYAITSPYFAAGGVNSPPLRALGNGIDGANGVYRYGSSAFPDASFNAANYWVDVIFAPTIDLVTVPNVVGQAEAAAVQTLTNADLTIGTVDQSSSTTVPEGHVISQSPAAGASVVTGWAVDLVVSTGPESATLTVAKSGNGSGTVTSTPVGIDCGATCTFDFAANTEVTLTPVADVGSSFSSWSGACTGAGACVVTMNAAKNVIATFALNSHTLTVNKVGSGSVTSTPAGLLCGATCTLGFAYNTAVTLAADADPGFSFSGWSGACTGTSACIVTMNAAQSVTATFTLNSYTLTVNKVGSGTVTSTPAGITCGATCAGGYNHNTVVTLNATPVAGWTFAGWQGALTGTTNPQALTMNSNKTVTATFTNLIFADGFESGNLAAWSTTVTDGGDLSVSAAAALVGSQGLQAVIDDNTVIYARNNSPNAETHYWARFSFDPNSIVMASGNAHYIFYGYSGASTVVLRVELRYTGSTYQLRAGVLNNSTTWTTSNWFTISDAPQVVAVDWQAASTSTATDGYLSFWLNGVQRVNLTGIANGTRRIDEVRLGPVGAIDTGTRGAYYFDAFESRRHLTP